MTLPDIPEGISTTAVRQRQTVAAPNLDRTLPPSRALGQWVDQRIEACEEEGIRVTDLAQEALAAFGADRDFINALVQERLESVIKGIVRTRIANTRRLRSRGLIGEDEVLTEVGNLVITLGGVKQRAEHLQASWGRRLESVNGRYILLLQMLRDDLLVAAETREQAAQGDFIFARLWRSLADDLAPGQKVSDRFSEQEIDARYREIQREVRGE